MVTECLIDYKKPILIITLYSTILTIVACSIYYGIKSTQTQPKIELDETLQLLVGNGLCDDSTNTNSFDFDGGDCCIQPLVIGDCKLCKCYQNGVIYSTTTETTSTKSEIDVTLTDTKISPSKYSE